MATTSGGIRSLLQKTIARNAPPPPLPGGAPPILRVRGYLHPVSGMEILGPEQIEQLVFELVSDEQKDLLLTQKEIDFSFAFGEEARYRVNAFHQRGYLAASLRRIPLKIPSLEEITLPKALGDFCNLPHGF